MSRWENNYIEVDIVESNREKILEVSKDEYNGEGITIGLFAGNNEVYIPQETASIHVKICKEPVDEDSQYYYIAYDECYSPFDDEVWFSLPDEIVESDGEYSIKVEIETEEGSITTSPFILRIE